jgi:hypothetical protein
MVRRAGTQDALANLLVPLHAHGDPSPRGPACQGWAPVMPLRISPQIYPLILSTPQLTEDIELLSRFRI